MKNNSLRRTVTTTCLLYYCKQYVPHLSASIFPLKMIESIDEEGAAGALNDTRHRKLNTS